MYHFYTDNENQQILISLLKSHGIKYVVASPGGTNPAFLASLQLDGNFIMFSSVDERSAAYMACGIAEETGEPVVICCTGATASRNYMPGLTEAYYRHLPVIAVTCSRPGYHIGNLMPQVTDRTAYPNDIVVAGEQIRIVKDGADRRECIIKINKILLEAVRYDGGPVHLNIECGAQSCNTKELPTIWSTHRITDITAMPPLPTGAIGIFIGSHRQFSEAETEAIETFCKNHNAVVFVDHTSGYYGKYCIQYPLLGTQDDHKYSFCNLDLLIHMGEISGDYFTQESLNAPIIWRVSLDGEMKVRFSHLNCIFEMPELMFFNHYASLNITKNEIYENLQEVYDELYASIPDLPLCHIEIAKELAPVMPTDSVIHLAIMNALRSWNFFKVPHSIRTNCNVGGFGIDGCTSSLIGASLIHTDKLYFLFSGDLAFFYDLNALGNRHIGKNIRIILVNDGKGAEFKHYRSVDHEVGIDPFIAGAGHFGAQSPTLVKGIAESLGFTYLSASTKEEFRQHIPSLTDPHIGNKPLILEVFTSTENQNQAWKILSTLAAPTSKEYLIKKAKEVTNPKIKGFIKNIIQK